MNLEPGLVVPPLPKCPAAGRVTGQLSIKHAAVFPSHMFGDSNSDVVASVPSASLCSLYHISRPQPRCLRDVLSCLGDRSA